MSMARDARRTRREVLAAAAIVGAAAPSLGAARAAQGAQRPNILWLVSEDNNPFIGAYGDPLAHTPAIDALAAKGLLFRHVYSTAPVCAPSRFGILTGVHPESCAPANHMRATAALPKAFRTYPELMRAAGYYCTNNDKTDYNCDVDAAAIWDVQGKEGHWRTRPPGTPFMAVFNYMTTHESRLFATTDGRVTADRVRVPAYLPDTPGIRRDIASYYNLMEVMDRQVGERLAELERDGLADDTIVFYYSDNGGVLGRSKRFCYDEGLRCAMVVYVPPKWRHLMPQPPGSVVETPVSFIDLAPTILALAGAAVPPQMRGRPLLRPGAAPQRFAFGMRDRMDERYDMIRTVTDGRWRYIRNYMPHRPLGQHQAFAWLARGYQDWEAEHLAGRLSPQQERFFARKPFEELYDLSVDRDEVDNRIDDPAAAAPLHALRQALDAHLRAINDNGFLPEGMRGEGYVESRDVRVYPLGEVMALAARAARGEARDIALLRRHLGSPVPVMRYWAAMGLLIRGPAAAPARAALLDRLADDVPQVRIVAAEALVHCGEAARALPVLTALVDRPPSWQVQLQAINALTFIGAAARPALPAVRRATTTPQTFVRSAARYLAAQLDGTYTPAMPIFDLAALRRGAG